MLQVVALLADVGTGGPEGEILAILGVHHLICDDHIGLKPAELADIQQGKEDYDAAQISQQAQPTHSKENIGAVVVDPDILPEYHIEIADQKGEGGDGTHQKQGFAVCIQNFLREVPAEIIDWKPHKGEE